MRSALLLLAALAGCESASLRHHAAECNLATVFTQGQGTCLPVPMASSAQDEEGKRFAPAPGKANIYVVRTGISGARSVFLIHLNGSSVGHVGAYTHLLIEVEAGTHLLSAAGAGNLHTQAVSVQPGENRFVEVVARLGWSHPRAEVRPLPPEEGRAAVLDTRRANTFPVRPLPVGLAAATPDPRTTFVSPVYGWSVAYPASWRLDHAQPDYVKLSRGPALVGIHTASVPRGSSLEQVADEWLRAWGQRIGAVYEQVGRRRVALANGPEAVEVEHYIGRILIGKSRKLIAVAGERAFLVDAETFLGHWPAFEREFDAIVGSFSFPK